MSNNTRPQPEKAAVEGLGAAEQGVREAHSGAAGHFRWRRLPCPVRCGSSRHGPRVVSPGGSVPECTRTPLLPEPEMAQDALDDILLVDERNDAHFP